MNSSNELPAVDPTEEEKKPLTIGELHQAIDNIASEFQERLNALPLYSVPRGSQPERKPFNESDRLRWLKNQIVTQLMRDQKDLDTTELYYE